MIAEAVETPWSTVGFHLTAAEIFRATGNEARAGEQLARADAITPRLATAHDAPLPWADGAFQ